MAGPCPPRAALVSLDLRSPLAFQAAVVEARKLFPPDTRPRDDGPEGHEWRFALTLGRSGGQVLLIR